jgi:hypothetical protein
MQKIVDEWLKDHSTFRVETMTTYGLWKAFCHDISTITEALQVAMAISADDCLSKIVFAGETLYLFKNGKQVFPSVQ